MNEQDTPRLSRLAAILTLLQTKRLLTATEIARRFQISVRTVYRDIRALEAAGVPVFTEEGKGYSLMEGYRLPPVAFTEHEAMALITAEQLVLKTKDSSLIREFSEAIQKIKAVFSHKNKAAVDLLSKRVVIGKNYYSTRNSDILIKTQVALTQFRLMDIEYTAGDGNVTRRTIEPYLLYHSAGEDWLLAAFCRLKGDFRTFRLDRINRAEFLDSGFEPHELTVEQFVKKYVFPENNP
ncbi:MAG TPA: YafY family protein [Saprospiraceae bacterium]|nr:YafY family protein [Saprospiraceae bacterium]HPI05569.1 YafY family protein [Saprospiraceae bacterium]